MKNVTKQLFLCVLILVTLLFSSCRNKTTGNNNGSGDNSSKSDISYRVVIPTSYKGEKFFDFLYAAASLSNVSVDFVSDSSSAAEYEIVWGNTNREISKVAYERSVGGVRAGLRSE